MAAQAIDPADDQHLSYVAHDLRLMALAADCNEDEAARALLLAAAELMTGEQSDGRGHVVSAMLLDAAGEALDAFTSAPPAHPADGPIIPGDRRYTAATLGAIEDGLQHGTADVEGWSAWLRDVTAGQAPSSGGQRRWAARLLDRLRPRRVPPAGTDHDQHRPRRPAGEPQGGGRGSKVWGAPPIGPNPPSLRTTR